MTHSPATDEASPPATAPSTPKPQATPATRTAAQPRLVLALVGLSLAAFTFVTFETLPVGLLLEIQSGLGATEAAVGRLVTIYALVVAATGIPLTLLLAHAPRRLVMVGMLAGLVMAGAASALVTGEAMLIVVRVVAAVCQAVFWSLVVPTAGDLVPQERHGRAVATVMGGSTLAAVAGLPAGTWLGQHLGWRTSFVVLAGFALLALLLVGFGMPGGRANKPAPRARQAPLGRDYWLLAGAITLGVTGSFAAFTYVVPYLTHASSLSAAAVGPVLLARGLLGMIGVWVGGIAVDRGSRWTMAAATALQVAAMIVLAIGSSSTGVAVLGVALSGLAFAALTTATAAKVLAVAPDRVEVASSGISTAVNVGIAAGGVLGGWVLAASGPVAPVWVGAAVSAAALALLVLEAVPRVRTMSPTTQQSTRQLGHRRIAPERHLGSPRTVDQQHGCHPLPPLIRVEPPNQCEAIGG